MTVEKTYPVLSQEHLNHRPLILSVTGPIWPHSPQCLNVGQVLRVDCGVGGEDDFVKEVVRAMILHLIMEEPKLGDGRRLCLLLNEDPVFRVMGGRKRGLDVDREC